MSIDLPLRPRNWTGVHDQRLVRHSECHPKVGRSAIPDGNPTVYRPLDFRKSEMIQKVAGSPAPGQDRLRIQKPSASKADVIAAIHLEALIQTAYYVLGRPEELLLLPAPDDFPPGYFAWVRQYCDTHHLHFLHDHAWTNPLADPDPRCTYPSRLPGQQQLGRRSKEVDDFSRRHLYLPLTDNDETVSLGKPTALSPKLDSMEQHKTSSTEGRTLEVFSECSSRQENKASPVFSEFCSLQRFFNDLLSLSEAVQSLHTRLRSVNATGGVVESKGIKPVNIIIFPHLGTAARDSEQDGGVETERTGTGSTQGQNDHGRSVQKQQRHATWPPVVGKKRSADSEDFSDHDDDDDDDDERPRKKITRIKDRPRFACPYWKYNPAQYVSGRSCSGPGWHEVKRVKEHVFRRHKGPDHQCPRCLAEFEDNQSKMQHCQAQETCNIGQSPSTTGFLDENKMRLLKQRGKTTASESEKWFSMYRILFPNETSLPSPYYEEREKRPEPPPRALAQEIFRENLDGALSRWGLDETSSTMGMHHLQVMDLMKSGALAAFDETFSALYNRRLDFPLDNRIPAIAASGLEETYDEEWPRPWMPLDTTGKDSPQRHKLEDVSERVLTRCSGSDTNTEPWKLDMVEGANLQIPNRRAITASVSNSDGKTIDTWFRPLQLQNPPAEPFSSRLQQQPQQEFESRILLELQHRKLARESYVCSPCGLCFLRPGDLHNHQRLVRSCRPQNGRPKGRPKKRSAPTTGSTSCQRQGRSDFDIAPPTPIETPEDASRTGLFDNHLFDLNLLQPGVPFGGLHDAVVENDQGPEQKGKGIARDQRALNTEALDHEKTHDGCRYEQAGMLNEWRGDSGIDNVWYTSHQNESSPLIADNHDFEDSALLPYIKDYMENSALPPSYKEARHYPQNHGYRL